MFNFFNYKIQWEVKSIESLEKMLKAINPKFLDYIEIFDTKKNKVIEKFNHWWNMDSDSAPQKVLSYMKKNYKDSDVTYRLIKK